jgi:hypothetical protein
MDGVASHSDLGDRSGHWHGRTAAGVTECLEDVAQVSRGVCYLGRQLERVQVRPMVSRPVGVICGCQQHWAPLTPRHGQGVWAGLGKSVEKAVTGAKPFELLEEVRGSLRALAPVVGSPGVGSEEHDIASLRRL